MPLYEPPKDAWGHASCCEVKLGPRGCAAVSDWWGFAWWSCVEKWVDPSREGRDPLSDILAVDWTESANWRRGVQSVCIYMHIVAPAWDDPNRWSMHIHPFINGPSGTGSKRGSSRGVTTLGSWHLA